MRKSYWLIHERSRYRRRSPFKVPLVLRDVSVDGIAGPCVRSWGGVGAPDASGLAGVSSEVVEADVPFKTKPI